MILPVGKQLLVKRVMPDAGSGIILPESVKSTHIDVKLYVEAVGMGCELGLLKGDSLILRPEKIPLIPVDVENELYLIPENCVIGVERKDGA